MSAMQMFFSPVTILTKHVLVEDVKERKMIAFWDCKCFLGSIRFPSMIVRSYPDIRNRQHSSDRQYLITASEIRACY
jgi:hypothetical protein